VPETDNFEQDYIWFYPRGVEEARFGINYYCDKNGKKPIGPKCMNGSSDDNSGYPIYAHISLYSRDPLIKDKNQVVFNFRLLNVIQFDDTDLSDSPKAVITEDYPDMAESSPQITQVKLNQLIPHHKRDASIQSLSFDHDLNINMDGMFRETRFNGFIGDWDVSRVWTMERMFYRNSAFNQPIGSWNVSNVTRMWSMFSGASSFNQDISGWDVSNVNGMKFMFVEASSFSQNISSWEVNKVRSHLFFSHLSGLTQEQIPPKFREED
jgi:surface protein